MRSGLLNTLGRTEPICGRWFGEMISAKMLPPKAGRVHFYKAFCSIYCQELYSLLLRRFCMRPDIRGAKSRPLLVAPIKITLGL